MLKIPEFDLGIELDESFMIQENLKNDEPVFNTMQKGDSAKTADSDNDNRLLGYDLKQKYQILQNIGKGGFG